MPNAAPPVADVVIVNIRELCTLAGPPGQPRRGHWASELGLLADAAVAIAGDRIVWVGRSDDAQRAVPTHAETRVLDARGLTVTPGLVDPHTHLVFGGSREEEFVQRLSGASYAEILAAGGGIHQTVAHTRAAAPETLFEEGRARLRRMLAHGTTTVEAKSGYGLSCAEEVKQLEVVRRLAAEGPLELVPTFMGAHAVPPGMEADAYTQLVIDEMLPEIARLGLARYVDVFCEQGVFTPAQTERMFAAAKAAGFGLRLHADELSDLGGGALAARWGAASADHLLMTGADSVAALAASDTVAVMLPGTPFFLGMRERAPARALLAAGAALAIGTDFNPGSCFSESMPMMMTLACLHLSLTPAEALVASTWNAAYSLGLSTRIGSIEVGKQADLVVWDVPNHAHLAYHFAVPLVKHVLKKGQVCL
ncbi:MAG: imidazolonepropionase [Candidatus Sericytochromatia bacterium]|nr:imidazolonepropionase [Candidatus Sericytochromatia bacterium]